MASLLPRLARWTGYAIAALVAVAVLAALGVYAQSERILRRTYEVPVGQVTAARVDAGAAIPSAALVENGKRLATIRGCYDGCHGAAFGGQVFFEQPRVARLVAPNLTQAAARYTDAELERIVRFGVRPDGRSIFAMPSETFRSLSGEDLAAILAFVRSVPASPGPGPAIDVGPLGRVGLVTGRFVPTAAVALSEAAARGPMQAAASSADASRRGRYLAATICSECHGVDLQGRGAIPPLTMVRAYDENEFRHLLRTGEAKGGRALGLMAKVARSRFSHLDDAEVAALHSYLRTLEAPGSS